MPVQIGKPPDAPFTNPLRLLTECHRRVEMFLHVLEQIANRDGAPLTGEEALSLENALRYFREAAPKHTADEEASLFPRLRELRDPALDDVLRNVERLESDHRAAAPHHETVDRLGRQWLAAGELSRDDAAALSGALGALVPLYREHIAVEDEQLFPRADAALSSGAKQEIAREMADRRGVGLR